LCDPLTWSGSVLGDLLAGGVTSVDTDAEQAEASPEEDTKDDQSSYEPRLIDQW